MRAELADAGYDIEVIGINSIGSEATQGLLAASCTFDLLQDESDVNAFNLMGGNKDDFFVYRANGRLAPGGYLPAFGGPSTNLSTDDGYANVRAAIIAAADLGPSERCDVEPPPGRQLPGDANSDAELNVADAIWVLDYLFGKPTEILPCDDTGSRVLLDVNGDGSLNISDPVYTLIYLFVGGTPPAGGSECAEIAGCPDVCQS